MSSASSASSSTDEFVLPESWRGALAEETEKPYFQELAGFVAQQRAEHQVFPPAGEVFSALEHTPYDRVKVLLLGQDPYHDDNQAHGMCFSVKRGVKVPPSLRNVYKELDADLGIPAPAHGNLEAWADQGVLLLNAVLTVRAHEPNSHKNRGWETFTDAILRKVADKRDQVVFVLWGGYAQKKTKLVDRPGHVIMSSAHPSPLSARNGFFGSKPFSAINAALRQAGQPPIDWQITEA